MLNAYDYENVVRKYKSYLLKIANMQAELRDIHEDLKDISDHLGDNGDPYIDAEAVLIDLGSLLADMTVYAYEYEEEMNKLPSGDGVCNKEEVNKGENDEEDCEEDR